MHILRRFIFPVSNLHTEWPVMEAWLELEEQERAQLAAAMQRRVQNLMHRCREMTGQAFSQPGAGQDCSNPAVLMADLVLSLQRAAGHTVHQCFPLATRQDASVCFAVEYDDTDVVLECLEIACQLVEDWLQDSPHCADKTSSLRSGFARIRARATATAMPADARALIAAAIRRGIPWYRMDREPFDAIAGAFRLRQNGLLRFGHGCHRLTLDGVFCVERQEPWHRLVRHRIARLDWLRKSGLPFHDSQARICLTPSRARKTLAGMGGEVWMASAVGSGLLTMQPVAADASFDRLAEGLLSEASELLVGRVPAGDGLELLWIDGSVPAWRWPLLPADGAVSGLPAEAVAVCRKLAQVLASDCLAVALVKSGDYWRIADFDLNPRLDAYCSDESSLERAADALLNALFPCASEGRIPIIAITGTNGKTTTCHMVESILLAAGYRVGMACSLGSRINGEIVSELEDGYLPGHLTVLGNDQVDVAVLESTRGGARSVGLGFDRCDYSACTNVAADHLGDDLGLRTVEELAGLKAWIALRASKGIVLNHDNPHSRAMIRQIGGLSLGVVSVEQSATQLRRNLPSAERFCTVEEWQGREWLWLSDGAGARRLLPVADVPMTMGGRARYNLSNAAHAVALCAAFGVADQHIVAGLMGLQPSFETLAGRMSFYQVGDFQLLFDYAHNPHGVEAVMDLVDRLPVQGRRRIQFTASDNRPDEFVDEMADRVAGHFDDYVCTNYATLYERRPDEVPGLLYKRLVSRGIDPARIHVIEDADAALANILASSRAGDLVVCLVGKSLREQWKIVERFGPALPVSHDAVGSIPAPGPSA